MEQLNATATTEGGALRKAVCVLMALVLALGLTPLPKQAYAAELQTASLGVQAADTLEIAAGAHQGTGKTSFEVTEADKSQTLYVQIQNFATNDTSYVSGGSNAYGSGFTATDCENFKVTWYKDSVSEANLIEGSESTLAWNDVMSNPKWTEDFKYTPQDIYTAADGTYKYYAVATYGSQTSNALEFTVTVNRGGSSEPEQFAITTQANPSEGGSVSVVDYWTNVSISTAKQGDTVQVNVTPASNYKVDSIQVLDVSSQDVSQVVGLEHDDYYDVDKFTMPGYAVKVVVAFSIGASVQKKDVTFEIRDSESKLLWEGDDYTITVQDAEGNAMSSNGGYDTNVFNLTVGETYSYTVKGVKDGVYQEITDSYTVSDEYSIVKLTLQPAASTPSTDPVLTLVVEPAEAASLVQLWEGDTQLALTDGKVAVKAGTEIEVAFQTSGTQYSPGDVSVTGTTVNTYGGTGYYFNMPSSDSTVTVTLAGGEPEPTKYAITKGAEDETQGTFSISASEAEENELIQVTTAPVEGKEVDYITVDGEQYGSAWTSDNVVWKFYMPAKNITVSVVFKDGQVAKNEPNQVSVDPQSTVNYTIAVAEKQTLKATLGAAKKLSTDSTFNSDLSDADIEATTFTWHQVSGGSDTVVKTEKGSLAKSESFSFYGKRPYSEFEVVGAEAGTYTYYCAITWEPEGYAPKTVNTANFVVAVTAPVSVNYAITKVEAQNGTFAVSAESAAEGETVTVTPTPAQGYELDAISVKDADGADVSVTGNTFTMPAKAVTVTVTFKKSIVKVAKPTAASFTYDGTEKTAVTAADGYTLSGDVKATLPGMYIATAKLAEGYAWADGSTDDVKLTWAISPVKVAKPTAASFTYDGTEKTAVTAADGYTLSGTTSAMNAGSYTATAKLAEGYAWADGTDADVALTWSIDKAKVTKPAAQSFTYDGAKKTAVAAKAGYTLSGTTSATNAGSYTAKATLDANYVWADGSTQVLALAWKINAATLKGATVAKVAAKAYTGKSIMPTPAVKLGKKTLKKDADYTLSYKSNKKVGKATITVTGKGNYTGSKNATFNIVKAANTLTVKAKAPSVKYSKKVAHTVAAKSAIAVSKAKGTVTYKKVSGEKNLTVAKNGKITVKAGCKKGSHKVKIAVTAAGNGSYKSLTKTVTVAVKVK